MADLIQLPFRAGIDEGTSPKQLPSGTLKRGENCYQDKTGRVRKRAGTTAHSAGAIGTGRRFVSRGKDLTLDDGTNLRNLDVSGYTSTNDRVSPLRVTRRPLFDTAKTPTLADVAISGNLLISVYREANVTSAGPIFAKVEHRTSGAVLLPITHVSTSAAGQWPRVLVYNGKGLILFQSGTQISYVEINLSTFAVSAQGNLLGLASPTSAGAHFDAVVVDTDLYVAFTNTNGGTFFEVVRLNTSYAIQATSATLAITPRAICLFATAGEYVHLTYSDAGTKLRTFNITTLTNVAGPTNVGSGPDFTFCRRQSATEVLVGWCVNSSSGGTQESLTTQVFNATTHAAVSGTLRKTWGLYAPTKPWVSNGRTYVAAVALSHAYYAASGEAREIPKPSVVVVEVRTNAVTSFTPPHRLAARLENLTGWYSREIINHGSPSGYVGHVANTPQDADGATYVAAAYRAIEPYGYTAIGIGFNLYKIEPADVSRSVAVGNSAVLAGGLPSAFDGTTLAPLGFTLAPIIISSTNPGGTTQAAGTYQYYAVYEWRSQDGVLHRSHPGPVFSVTLGAAGGVSLTITNASLDHHLPDSATAFATSGNPVIVAIYRTEANGDTFYRLTNEPLSLVQVSDPTAATFTLDVSRSDGKVNLVADTWAIPLASRPELYTEGPAELEDNPPPAFIAQCVHRGRLCGIASDRRTFCASKDQSEDAGIFPGFNVALTLAFDEDKTCLLSLDERIAVFAENGIDIIEGLGPDVQGQNNDWRVYRVQTDLGCNEPRSLVAVPQGILYQSRRGIELLSRALEVVYVGAAVEDTLATYPTITSATLIAGEQQVRFTCTTTDGASGRVLVFDYGRNAWYVWDYLVGTAFVDSAVINNEYRLLKSNGQVYTEDLTDCLDGSAYVPMLVEVPVYPGGAASWHRLKDVGLVGQVVSACDLTLAFARTSSTEQQKTFQLSGGTFESVKVTMKYQKSQAYSVTIVDASPTAGGAVVATGQGPVLDLLSLYVQRKGGTPRLRQERKG
jgi:hypothetical protein